MNIVTNRPIIIGSENKSYFPNNPFQKSSSDLLTNPWANKGTFTPTGMPNPFAKSPTNYLQQSIDAKKEQEFKNSPEYAEMQKRIEERKNKIEEKKNADLLTSDEEKKNADLLTSDEKKTIKKIGTTGLIVGGVLMVGTAIFIIALVKALKK